MSEVEVGDRYLDLDPRSEGRVVEVREVFEDEVVVQVEVHPTNPTAVGRHSTISFATLDERYKRISR